LLRLLLRLWLRISLTVLWTLVRTRSLVLTRLTLTHALRVHRTLRIHRAVALHTRTGHALPLHSHPALGTGHHPIHMLRTRLALLQFAPLFRREHCAQ